MDSKDQEFYTWWNDMNHEEYEYCLNFDEWKQKAMKAMALEAFKAGRKIKTNLLHPPNNPTPKRFIQKLKLDSIG